MKPILILLILLAFSLPALNQGNLNSKQYIPFISGNDTIANVTTPDTIFWQHKNSYLTSDPHENQWNQLADFVTAAEKLAEKQLRYPVSKETTWGFAQQTRFKIRNGNDSLLSIWMDISTSYGNWSLFVEPDTLELGATDKTLYRIRFSGQ